MNGEMHALWSTPVLVVRNAAPVDLNDSLIEGLATKRYFNPKKLHEESRTFHEVHDLAQIIATHAANLASSYYNASCTATVEELWANDYALGDSHSVHNMHAHPRYHLVATYYPQVSGGDLCLFNPSGTSLWSVAKSRGPSNNFIITPEPRMMVLFPGNIIHNTMPDRSGKKRICMPANISLQFPEHA